MAIADPDFTALRGVIETVNSARDPRAFRAAVLPAMRELVPCALAAYNEIDHGGGSAYALADPEPDEFPDPGAAMAPLIEQNPLIVHYAATRDGSARQIADFMTVEEWKTTDYYKVLFEPQGVLHQIAITLPSQQSLTIGIALNDERLFTPRDRTLLDLVRPHLIGAYRNAQLHAIAGAQLRALERGLDGAGAGAGVVVLGREDVVHAAGAQAHELLRLGPRLADPVRTWVAERRASPTDGPPLVLPRDGNHGDASVIVRFLRGKTRAEPDLLLVEPRPDPLDAAALVALGLTQRQAGVLRLLALGRPTEAIATDLGISHGTVRKHLENIYRRLGVTTRWGAAAAAWAGAEAAGAAPDPPGAPSGA